MAAITWDSVGERQYETGLDRGVLYFPEGGGVPWNGMISLEQEVSTEIEPIYFDGVKVNDVTFVGDFSAKLKAFTYPEALLRFEGNFQDQSGVLVTGQPAQRFHLSWRTKIGNDVTSEAGYKIHLLYNVTALPSERENNSISDQVEPIEFEWTLTAIPEVIDFFRPTAYLILDSSRIDPYLMVDIEEVLYGTAEVEPSLPSMKGLSAFIRKWNRLVIIDNGDGTWSATSDNPEYPITMLDSTTFQIVSDTATIVDANTYTISSTEKNEEDLWLP